MLCVNKVFFRLRHWVLVDHIHKSSRKLQYKPDWAIRLLLVPVTSRLCMHCLVVTLCIYSDGWTWQRLYPQGHKANLVRPIWFNLSDSIIHTQGEHEYKSNSFYIMFLCKQTSAVSISCFCIPSHRVTSTDWQHDISGYTQPSRMSSSVITRSHILEQFPPNLSVKNVTRKRM